MGALRACVVLAAAVAVAAAVAAGVGSAPRQPGLLEGAPLGRATGLRLAVADVPPFLLDVDSRRSARVAGVPDLAQVVSVLPVGGRSAVIAVDPGERTRFFGVT